MKYQKNVVVAVSIACFLLLSSMGLWLSPVLAQQQSFGQPTVLYGVSCGTTSACAATPLSTTKIAQGSAPLVTGTPSTLTVTGLTYSSATSYNCSVDDYTTSASALAFVKNSGTNFTVTGPNAVTDTIGYVCAGN